MLKGSHRRDDSPDTKFYAAAHRLFLCSLFFSLESTLHKSERRERATSTRTRAERVTKKKVAHFFHAPYHPPNVHHRPVIYVMMIFFKIPREISVAASSRSINTSRSHRSNSHMYTANFLSLNRRFFHIELRVHYPRHNKKENI